MTDWDRIAQEIRRVMEEAGRLQRSAETLGPEADREVWIDFAERIYALQARLAQMLFLLQHEDRLLMDELAEAMNRWSHVGRPEHRITPPLETWVCEEPVSETERGSG